MCAYHTRARQRRAACGPRTAIACFTQIHCSAAAPAVDTCVDHSALVAALAELKASPLTRVKLSESEISIDSAMTAQVYKLSPTSCRVSSAWYRKARPSATCTRVAPSTSA